MERRKQWAWIYYLHDKVQFRYLILMHSPWRRGRGRGFSEIELIAAAGLS